MKTPCIGKIFIENVIFNDFQYLKYVTFNQIMPEFRNVFLSGIIFNVHLYCGTFILCTLFQHLVIK